MSNSMLKLVVHREELPLQVGQQDEILMFVAQRKFLGCLLQQKMPDELLRGRELFQSPVRTMRLCKIARIASSGSRRYRKRLGA